MSVARLFFLVAFMALAAGLVASPGSACVIVAPVCVGSKKMCHPNPAQQLANERRWSSGLTLQRATEARRQLAAGRLDLSAELAELLIPNIRPIHVLRSDCGIEGEVDYGAGEETVESFFHDVVAGSSLAGSDADEFAGPLRRAMGDFSFGAACNEEFRQHFAAYLAGTVEPADLKEAWLFLSPRQRGAGTFGPRYPRLMRFEGAARAPPVRWTFADRWLGDQAATALKGTRWGRSISAAVDRFWSANGTRLSDDLTVCPRAVAEWARVRHELLEQMLASHAARQRRSGH
ncbi:MAG TPA: hypothetical protein VH331_01065 [Allosphingosinicella sp.]|nr:hypothetical protein [Allosphingosinicella sp.]